MTNMPSFIWTPQLSKLIACLPHGSDNEGSAAVAVVAEEDWSTHLQLVHQQKHLLGMNAKYKIMKSH